jgi:circadian clock protein KaiC
MTDSPSPSVLARRVPTGITGLDTITRGGFFRAGLYIVVGRPGSGKTTLGNQVCFEHVRRGGRAVYVTLLAENHARMLSQMHGMRFFDEALVGAGLLYVNGFSALQSEGLAGLLAMLRRIVREHRADLLVLDGMMNAGAVGATSVEYKKFINELQTWVGMVGCTVLFLRSAGNDVAVEPEYTMVDGILELRSRRRGLESLRQLVIRKYRGTAYLEGAHPYEIASEGIVVYPRIEAQLDSYPAAAASQEQLSSGVPGLDALLGGGYPTGSSTLLLGASGVGKTTFGLHFVAEGARRREAALVFGFYEPPAEIIAVARALGLATDGWGVQGGPVALSWRSPAENILDELAYDLVLRVRGAGVKRLFIDGLNGFRACAYPERLPGFFAVLHQELRALGVTTMYSEEGTRLVLGEISGATSALFDNVIRLRHASEDGRPLRTLEIKKVRKQRHDRRRHAFEITGNGVVLGASEIG